MSRVRLSHYIYIKEFAVPGDPIKADKFINALTAADPQALSKIVDKHVGPGMINVFKNYILKLFPNESAEVRDPLEHLMLMGYMIHVNEIHNLVRPKQK